MKTKKREKKLEGEIVMKGGIPFLQWKRPELRQYVLGARSVEDIKELVKENNISLEDIESVDLDEKGRKACKEAAETAWRLIIFFLYNKGARESFLDHAAFVGDALSGEEWLAMTPGYNKDDYPDMPNNFYEMCEVAEKIKSLAYMRFMIKKIRKEGINVHL